MPQNTFWFVHLVCMICFLANWLDMRVVRAADVQKEATKNLKDLTDLLEGSLSEMLICYQ